MYSLHKKQVGTPERGTFISANFQPFSHINARGAGDRANFGVTPGDQRKRKQRTSQ